MDLKEFEEKQSKLASQIDEKLTAFEQNLKDNAEKKADKQIVDEIKSLLDEDKKLKGKQQEHLDKLDVEIKKLRENGASTKKAFLETFKKNLEEGQKKFKENKNSGSFEVKAVGDMISGTQFPTAALPESPLGTPKGLYERRTHIRDLFRVSPIGVPVFPFLKETGGEGAPTTVAEGALKPQSDFDFTRSEANAKKIAHHAKLSEELIMDVPYLSSYIQNRMVEKLMFVEDTQLLSGDGTGSNLTGILASPDVTATDNPLAGLVDNANKLDAFVAAAAKLATKSTTEEYEATAFVINPEDYYQLLVLKNSNNDYLRGGLVVEDGIMRMLGKPVVKSTAVTAGNLLAGDFRNGAEILQREPISARFYDQNEDDPIYNMITIVVEERIIFPIYYAGMFTYDAFADTQAAIETT